MTSGYHTLRKGTHVWGMMPRCGNYTQIFLLVMHGTPPLCWLHSVQGAEFCQKGEFSPNIPNISFIE